MVSKQHTLRSPEDRAKRDRGASLVEYALLLALIAVVCIGALTAFGTATDASFSRSSNSIVVAN
jgi:pilus assembly protein Flp/PilA